MIRLPSPARLLLPLVALVLLTAVSACSPRPSAAAGASASPAAAIIPVPPELTAALAAYRAAGPKGWAFTQTTTGPKKNLVERFDPRVRGPGRWALLQKDGATPTEEDQRAYRQTSAAKNDADNPSSVRDQLNLATCTVAASDARTTTYHFAVNPASKEDTAAPHLRAAFTLDRPTGAIVRVELFNFEPFSPVTSLKIDEAHTVMLYTVPAEGRPSLLSEITMKLRGRRLWVRPFNEDMTMRYTDQVDTTAAPASAPPVASPQVVAH